VKFIEEHRERWGVEPICRALQFAPATYYAASTRPPSARAVWDQGLKPQIQRVWNENFRVYGADKVWAQLRREGFLVARCTVERLLRELGLRGVVRGRTPRTTMAADGTDRPVDLVDRHFVAAAPNRLWVADLTYVKTHSGWVYLAFIVDVFSRYVVGWQASRSLRTERLAQAGAVPSVGSRGDSYDNALAESFNGLYKTELIRKDGPWRGLEDVEYATLEWVDWFNQRRLQTELGMVPPAEFEASQYHEEAPASLAVSH
jgi:putative transposase